MVQLFFLSTQQNCASVLFLRTFGMEHWKEHNIGREVHSGDIRVRFSYTQ